ncbi:unnamed protein product [Peniophora sp. CBMAI 1063]|nr:unnamed protein product [Peniophora sp. CBMAI 1063]
MARLGPEMFDIRPRTGNLTKLADGLRFEAAVQAAISGALAIRGVPPMKPSRSVGRACQYAAFNTADGGYDILEGECRHISGPDERWGIPDSPVAPRSVSDIPKFVKWLGLTVELDAWWEEDEVASLDGEAAQSAIAFHLMTTTERFGHAPPIKGHGRNGERPLLAPDLVNTLEHLDAQMKQLRLMMGYRRLTLQEAIVQAEDHLLAGYHHLYKGAPAAAQEIKAVGEYFLEHGERYGGPEMMNIWISDWSNRFPLAQ